jgi:hypothetical protein
MHKRTARLSLSFLVEIGYEEMRKGKNRNCTYKFHRPLLRTTLPGRIASEK